MAEQKCKPITDGEAAALDRLEESRCGVIFTPRERFPTDTPITAAECGCRLGIEGTHFDRTAVVDRLPCKYPEALRTVQELQTRVGSLERGFGEHAAAVGQFLSELHATMVDPCAEGTIPVQQMRELLLAAARDNRQSLADTQAKAAKYDAGMEAIRERIRFLEEGIRLERSYDHPSQGYIEDRLNLLGEWQRARRAFGAPEEEPNA